MLHISGRKTSGNTRPAGIIHEATQHEPVPTTHPALEWQQRTGRQRQCIAHLCCGRGAAGNAHHSKQHRKHRRHPSLHRETGPRDWAVLSSREAVVALLSRSNAEVSPWRWRNKGELGFIGQGSYAENLFKKRQKKAHHHRGARWEPRCLGRQHQAGTCNANGPPLAIFSSIKLAMWPFFPAELLRARGGGACWAA